MKCLGCFKSLTTDKEQRSLPFLPLRRTCLCIMEKGTNERDIGLRRENYLATYTKRIVYLAPLTFPPTTYIIQKFITFFHMKNCKTDYPKLDLNRLKCGHSITEIVFL